MDEQDEPSLLLVAVVVDELLVAVDADELQEPDLTVGCTENGQGSKQPRADQNVELAETCYQHTRLSLWSLEHSRNVRLMSAVCSRSTMPDTGEFHDSEIR